MNCPVPVAAGSEAALSAHGIPKCQALKGAHSAPSQQVFKKEQQAPGEGAHGKTGEEMHGGRNGSDEGSALNFQSQTMPAPRFPPATILGVFTVASETADSRGVFTDVTAS